MRKLWRQHSVTQLNPRTRARAVPVGKREFWTWPRKIAAVIAPLILAWAIPYFGPGLVQTFRAASGQDLLSVTVLTDDQFRSDAHVHHRGERLINRPLSELKAFDVANNLDKYPGKWPDAGTTLIRLVLRGKSSMQVTVQRINVVVTQRNPPAPGVVKTGDKGSGVIPHYVDVDLDTEEISWSDAEGASIGPLALRVSDSEEELVDLRAFTEGDPADGKGCDCYWRVELTYTADGGEPEIRSIGAPAGGDFRTSSLGRATVWNVSVNTCEDVLGLPPLCDTAP